jgi:hypothetical protein
VTPEISGAGNVTRTYQYEHFYKTVALLHCFLISFLLFSLTAALKYSPFS